MSNASFAPAHTLESSEAKKSDADLLDEKSLPVAAAALEEVVLELLPLTARAIVDARSATVVRERNPMAAFNLVLSWCFDSVAGGHILLYFDDEQVTSAWAKLSLGDLCSDNLSFMSHCARPEHSTVGAVPDTVAFPTCFIR